MRQKEGSRASKIRRLLAKGWEIHEIADKLAGSDQRKRKAVRSQLHMMIKSDEATQVILGRQAHGELIAETPAMVSALVRRAKRGNVPAIKLAMEASGFHNPRVQHDHSGEIAITIKGLPRPTRTEDIDHVVDAEVVE